MKSINFKKLRDGGFLTFDSNGGAALITRDGWLTLPEPLASVVRRAVEHNDG